MCDDPACRNNPKIVPIAPAWCERCAAAYRDLRPTPGAKPWGSDVSTVPLEGLAAFREQCRKYGEPVEEWVHRMNTSDEPGAVAFRERWNRPGADREE